MRTVLLREGCPVQYETLQRSLERAKTGGETGREGKDTRAAWVSAAARTGARATSSLRTQAGNPAARNGDRRERERRETREAAAAAATHAPLVDASVDGGGATSPHGLQRPGFERPRRLQVEILPGRPPWSRRSVTAALRRATGAGGEQEMSARLVGGRKEEASAPSPPVLPDGSAQVRRVGERNARDRERAEE